MWVSFQIWLVAFQSSRLPFPYSNWFLSQPSWVGFFETCMSWLKGKPGWPHFYTFLSYFFSFRTRLTSFPYFPSSHLWSHLNTNLANIDKQISCNVQSCREWISWKQIGVSWKSGGNIFCSVNFISTQWWHSCVSNILDLIVFHKTSIKEQLVLGSPENFLCKVITTWGQFWTFSWWAMIWVNAPVQDWYRSR